jgi:hypothetical protein
MVLTQLKGSCRLQTADQPDNLYNDETKLQGSVG